MRGTRRDIYLNHDGTCAAVFRFYEEHLGGTMTGGHLHTARDGASPGGRGRQRRAA
jgi:hypothetical protein